MPRRRLYDRPMTNAERQRRHRDKLREGRPAAMAPVRRFEDDHGAPGRRRPSRAQRWAQAATTLIELQAEYAAWLDQLPERLRESPLANKLRTVTKLKLRELLTIELPRGVIRGAPRKD